MLPEPPHRCPSRTESLGVCALLLLVLTAGLWARGEQLLGWQGGELYGHAWVQWWHGEALWGWPSGTTRVLGASSWPVVDPLNTVLAALLGKAFGYPTGWNALIVLGIALGFFGGAFLARRAGGSPLVGGIGVALSPVFLGSVSSGLTEDLGLGVVAFSLGLLIYPVGHRDRLWGGALLGLTTWTGLYLTFLAAIVAAVLGIRALWRREEAREWVLAGVLAAAVALPALGLFGGRLLGEGHRFGEAQLPAFEPLWRFNPVRAVDLASFVDPRPMDLPKDAVVRLHPMYLGWGLLLCALQSRSRGWWLLVGACVLYACGPEFRFAGQATGLPNPVHSGLNTLPFFDRINHAGRMMLIGHLALVVLAAKGARRLGSPRVVAAVLTLELFALGPRLAPLPTTPSEVAEVFSELEARDGRVLVLPMGGPGLHPQKALYEQRAHARDLALRPNVPGPVLGTERSPTGAWLFGLGKSPAPPLPDQVDVSGFLKAKITTIVVREGWVREAALGLGEPHLETGGGAIWHLTQLSLERGGAI